MWCPPPWGRGWLSPSLLTNSGGPTSHSPTEKSEQSKAWNIPPCPSPATPGSTQRGSSEALLGRGPGQTRGRTAGAAVSSRRNPGTGHPLPEHLGRQGKAIRAVLTK